MPSDKKTALVCEGYPWLGSLINAAFDLHGLRVINTSSTQTTELNGHTLRLDFYSQESVSKCVDVLTVKDWLPDIIVLGGPPPIDGYNIELDDDAWIRASQLLWTGPVSLVSRLLPTMVERGYGRIIWLTNVNAHRFTPGKTIAHSLQSGIHGLVRSLADEYRDNGITVNALIPNVKSRRSPAAVQEAGNLSFARYVAFLASDAAAYVSGQLLVADVDAVP